MQTYLFEHKKREMNSFKGQRIHSKLVKLSKLTEVRYEKIAS